jgi:hypothetical protein
MAKTRRVPKFPTEPQRQGVFFKCNRQPKVVQQRSHIRTGTSCVSLCALWPNTSSSEPDGAANLFFLDPKHQQTRTETFAGRKSQKNSLKHFKTERSQPPRLPPLKTGHNRKKEDDYCGLYLLKKIGEMNHPHTAPPPPAAIKSRGLAAPAPQDGELPKHTPEDAAAALIIMVFNAAAYIQCMRVQ